MQKTTIVFGTIALTFGAALGAMPAGAHHSFAMFDNTKTVTVNGTVDELEWTNPHAWIHVMAPGQDGKAVKWSLEMASVVQMQAGGWKRDSVKPGDKVTVNLHPLKDGTRGGQFMNLTFADGHKIGSAGAVPKNRVPPKEY